MSFLEIALQCAARGWHVHPLKPGGKVPTTPHGKNDATTDEEQIRAWWSQVPTANVGLSCGPSGLCVLDIDNGLADEAAFLAWRESVGLPVTYTVRTGRRPGFGAQMYFSGAVPDVGLWELGGCSGQVKSLGGLVLAAGCLHPSGATYEVLCSAPPAPTPEVVRKLQKPRAEVKPGEPIRKLGVGEGRHPLMISKAGSLRALGLGEDAILAGLLDFNEQHCADLLSLEELQSMARFAVTQWEAPAPVPKLVMGKAATPEKKVITDWREHYHTREETEHAPPPEFLIDGFLQRQAIVGVAGYVGHKKSLIAQNISYSLCSGEPLFGHFKVLRKPSRVLYLCPEMALIGFANRVKKIGLLPYVGETFFYATMSLQDGVIKLPDLMAEEVEGAVIFLDTAIRFIEGDENSSEHMKELATQAFTLIRSGAEAVIVLAHSNKEMMKSSELTLDNAMRGSSELTAFLSSCWATRIQDPEHPYESASLLKHVKPRDFEADPFEVLSDRETCRMTFVEGSRGATVARKTTANVDGREEDALQVIRDNPNLSDRKMVTKLKDMGIDRKKGWVNNKKYELLQQRGGVL